MQAQKLDKEILQILHADNDINCENKLVMLLDYDKFNLIKLLVKNRWEILLFSYLVSASLFNKKKRIESDNFWFF